jgi:hypothetical protein
MTSIGKNKSAHFHYRVKERKKKYFLSKYRTEGELVSVFEKVVPAFFGNLV